MSFRGRVRLSSASYPFDSTRCFITDEMTVTSDIDFVEIKKIVCSHTRRIESCIDIIMCKRGSIFQFLFLECYFKFHGHIKW